jgi:hypothetical protein
MKLPVDVENIILNYKEQLERMNEHHKKWQYVNQMFEAYDYISKRTGVPSLFVRRRHIRAVRHIVFEVEAAMLERRNYEQGTWVQRLHLIQSYAHFIRNHVIIT